ncbi:hypothetical protein NX801_16425 [Streptomyces sp. LP05-1]|uniref:Uncharacterized protein n=1 Tax=Streptomyces pyxinae TaxID=2970734 RepID=A0ABT2CKZ0_9ACTN|nr:hypothetical protein [Streptomyces sp. LP05-1]MCS0637219.1 hypothetical protein [Streptomyces sp. LP05-1]
MNLRSSWVAETGQTREDTRLTQVGATTPRTALEARTGVLPGSSDGRSRLTGFRLEGTSAMSATVAEGRGVIQGQSGQGVYPVTLTTPEALTFDAGDGQYGRVDLVVVRVYDSLYDSSNRHEAVVEIVPGTPAATPAAPAVPPLSLPLYTVSVPAGAGAGNGGINWNSAVTDLRSVVVGLGGILPAEGSANPPGAYPGQYQDAGGALQRWDGSAWVPYPYALGGIAPSGAVSTASYTGQYRDAGGALQRWNGTAWTPVVPVPTLAGTFDDGYTTSTTYTATLTDRAANAANSLTFTVPPSGVVLITLGARMQTSSASVAGWMTFRITRGSTVVWEANDQAAVTSTGLNAASASTTTRLYGLTPGAHTITGMYRAGANTTQVKATFTNTFIRVDAST